MAILLLVSTNTKSFADFFAGCCLCKGRLFTVLYILQTKSILIEKMRSPLEQESAGFLFCYDGPSVIENKKNFNLANSII